MPRAGVLLLLALLFPASLLAQDAEPRRIASDECGFSIEMMAKPDVMVDSTVVRARMIRSTTYTAQVGALTEVATCSTYPFAEQVTTDEQAMMVLRGGARAQLAGVDTSRIVEVRVQDYPGVAFTEWVTDSLAIYHRAFLIDDRMVQLSVGSFQEVSEDHARAFLTSFRLE